MKDCAVAVSVVAEQDKADLKSASLAFALVLITSPAKFRSRKRTDKTNLNPIVRKAASTGGLEGKRGYRQIAA